MVLLLLPLVFIALYALVVVGFLTLIYFGLKKLIKVYKGG